MRSRTKAAVLLVGVSLTFALAACTHAGPGPASTVTRTEVTGRSVAAIPTTPVVAGPTTSATRDCPLVPLTVVMPSIGQRLAHSTVQTSGGTTVGCKFYPVATGLGESENLPGKGFPSAQITLTTYPSAESARQVLAIVSRAGGSPSLQSIDGLVAETFQTRFYPPDGQADWACAFIKGSRLITVLVAENTGQGQANAVALAEAFTARD